MVQEMQIQIATNMITPINRIVALQLVFVPISAQLAERTLVVMENVETIIYRLFTVLQVLIVQEEVV
jgi:hypothetical protein